MPIYVLPLMAAVIYGRAAEARRGVVVMLVIFALLVGAYVTAVSRAAGRLVIVDNIAELHWHFRGSPSSTDPPGLSTVLPAMARRARAAPSLFAYLIGCQAKGLMMPAPWDEIAREQFPACFLRVLQAMAIAFLAIIVFLPIRGVMVASQRTAAIVLPVWGLAQVPLILLSGTAVVPRFRAPLDPALLALAAAAMRRL